MTFIGIILIISLIWLVFGNRINAWIRNWMMGMAEDRMRRMMGMPTRKEERRRKKQRRQRRDNGNAYGPGYGTPPTHDDGPVIPREYAEDVEYVDMPAYSDETEINGSGSDNRSETVFNESQVEDAEYVEIKQ